MRAAAAATLRTLPRAALAIPAPVRRWLIAGIASVIVIWALYSFWFRDSSFVKISHVKISGLHTDDAGRISQALTAAARDMSTLHVRQGALMAAVANYTAVKDVVATPHFPHGLTIKVIQERPVALLQANGSRVLLAADGSVLRGIRAAGLVPSIRTNSTAPARTLTDPVALTQLHVAAAAPPALSRRIASIGRGKTRGIVVRLKSGPQIIFGDDTRVDAKWAAAAGVLADPTSKGASYVDVRLPERPVAGGLSTSSLAPLGVPSATSIVAPSTQGTATQTGTSSQGATGATGPNGTTGPNGSAGSTSGTQTQGTPTQTTPSQGGGAAGTNPQP
jgi:cell division protein FtsQ